MGPKGALVMVSGPHAGKALEQIVFSDPLWVRNFASRAECPFFRRHAKWLLEAGENRKAPVCPLCGVSMADCMVVHYARDDFSITGILCAGCAVDMGEIGPRFLPLKLSSAMMPKLPGDRRRIAQYLKKVWGLRRLTAQKAFEFFSAPGREESELTLPL